jgi:hypothetical protein
LGRSFADVQPMMVYMDNLVTATLTPAHNIPASCHGEPFRTRRDGARFQGIHSALNRPEESGHV